MPNDCQVTKLKGVVNNSELEMLGLLGVTILKAVTNNSEMKCYPDWNALENIASGSATFSWGQTYTIGNFPDGQTFMRVTASANTLLQFDKYGITGLDLPANFVLEKHLAGSSLTRLSIGNIRNYANLNFLIGSSITDLVLNIYNMASLDDPSALTVSFGDIGQLLPNIEKITITITDRTIMTGDAGAIAGFGELYLFDCSHHPTMTWGSTTLRPSSYPIISIPKALSIGAENSNNFIINMANCQASSKDTNKVIKLTSYDNTDPDVLAAISTLSGKGYTVSKS